MDNQLNQYDKTILQRQFWESVLMGKTFSSKKRRSSSIWKYSTHSTSYDLHWWNSTWHFFLYDRMNYPRVTQDEKSFCPPSATSSTSSWWWNVDRLKELDVRRSKNIFFQWNGPVLIHCVDEDKTRDHNYSSRWAGMKLIEENGGGDIDCEVVNCLREEGVNMQHIRLTVARCDDWMKRRLIVDENEKWFGGEKYWRRRIFEKLF